MEQKIEPLSEADAAELGELRSWVRNHYTPDARHQYDTVEGKLCLLEAILNAGWIRPGETLKLHCLGVTFGDALVQELGMVWVAVEDQYGRDPAIHYTGSTVLAFPKTMLAKRVEAGEAVNPRDFFAALCRDLPALRDQADRL